jgi:hypothetical protein
MRYFPNYLIYVKNKMRRKSGCPPDPGGHPLPKTPFNPIPGPFKRWPGEYGDVKILRSLHNRVQKQAMKVGIKGYADIFIPEMKWIDKPLDVVVQAARRS